MKVSIDPTTTNLEVVSSYVEDGKDLNILVPMSASTDEKAVFKRFTH